MKIQPTYPIVLLGFLNCIIMSKCPENPLGNAFFLRPLPRQRLNQWYSCQPIGHNNLCKKAGIAGNRANHSLRASAATRLFHQNIPEQVIVEVTGHKSTDGVRTYKKVIRDQLRDVSNVLQGSSVEDVKNETKSKEKMHVPTSDINSESSPQKDHPSFVYKCYI